MTAHGRQWADHHIAAGYHEQDWGPPPTVDCELLGSYESATGTMTVSLVQGESGVAELEIAWADGGKVTVLNEETALKYLILEGAAEIV